ncbi:hypothetical protein QFC20_005756 [Naganishia adeliensis]|uniref:Uncharacterized protein n=1 Tax=Naganishia adeliensis TaxID=92952 RepID=A0ACC2VIW6_9TREE|nr:hypothetical protein QFC20_005756 [Naganishia adeliensis]
MSARPPAIRLARCVQQVRSLHTTLASHNTQLQRRPEPKHESEELTSSAKLLAEAFAEEEEEARNPKRRRRRTAVDRIADDSPVWTGEENTRDAVLRMLMDTHKPLRSDVVATAEQKIKDLTKKLDMEPIFRDNTTIKRQEQALMQDLGEEGQPAERSQVARQIELERQIPPEEFRPWMAQYIAKDQDTDTPSIFHGKFLSSGPSSRGKAATKDREDAREGALDYRLGGGEGYQGKGTSAAGGGVRGGPSGVRAWQSLVEDRIEIGIGIVQRARNNGWFNNVQGRGKPIAHDSDENNPYIDRGEYFMNRIVKRQGAKPPWIELLGELETAHTAFRSSLLSSYVRSIVRSLTTSPFQSRQSLAQLTTEQVQALRDPKWQTREMAYHTEAIKDLNNTVRKMNAMAPPVARRGLVVLDDELALTYRAAAPLIMAELAKRSNEDWDKLKELEATDGYQKGRTGSQRIGREVDAHSEGAKMFKWEGLGVMEAIRSLFRRGTQ